MIDEQLSDDDRQRLSARLGAGLVERRLERERLLTRKKTSRGLLDLFGGRVAVIAGCVRALGLGSLGRRNFLDVRLVENRIVLPALPPAFEGFRLLQLSDLHCDLDPALMDVVEQAIRGITCDAVVLTGDYHDHIGTSGKTSLALMRRLIPLLPHQRFAILGNHDFLCRLPAYEASGLPVLLNENASIERGNDRLYFCGVDDPRFFRTHDLVRARRGIPSGAPAILLAHSPEVAAQAAALGYSLMLSGHTHGGQLCLPGGIAILRNAPVAARFLAGAWAEGGMPGYTSRGTGGSTVAARLFCPPEITLHILRRSGL
ncbi:MAG: metallophosphoesterase [Verrucomicrobia bacterium]|nr:metallophosphoesterase [Verrucomicrobiota bacterium]